MKALVNTPNADIRLTMRDVPEPEPREDEVVIDVRAFSINRGELALMRARAEGWRPGQDVAGVVERPAADGRGPKTGDRVAALIEGAGWAERVAVPVERLARVPDNVGWEQAAGLPMVGLTAMGLVRRCGPVLGRKIVVTGASGGVGSVLVQLGALAGSEVIAIARAEHGSWLSGLGATSVVPTLSEVTNRVDFILESVGGSSLEDAVTRVLPDGKIICFGNSSGTKSAFDIFAFFGAENASVETFFSYRALYSEQTGASLGYLLNLIAAGHLELQTTALKWEEIGSALSLLERRGTRGKIVLVKAG